MVFIENNDDNSDLDPGQITGRLSDFVPLVREIFSKVIRKDYDGLLRHRVIGTEEYKAPYYSMTVNRLHEILDADPYPFKLIEPPDYHISYFVSKAILIGYGPEIDNHPLDKIILVGESEWELRMPMWTSEEGCSDLCLTLYFFVNSDRIFPVIRNLHVP